MSVVLNEEFESSHGEWNNYGAYDPTLRATLRDQQHVDIRNMEIADLTASRNVLELSRLELDDLAGLTMTQVQALTTAIKAGEKWTAGTNASLATHNGLRVLQIPPLTASASSVIAPIDLLTDFANDDFVSLALPSFPLSGMDTTQTFIDFTSNASGDFTAGPTASVTFSSSSVALVEGNSEFRVLRSAFNQNGINLGSITGVRIRLGGRQNLVTNPSFETGTSPWFTTAGNSIVAGATLTQQAGTSPVGNNYARVVTAATLFQGAEINLGTLQAGQQYTMRFWLRRTAGGSNLQAWVRENFGGFLIYSVSVASVNTAFQQYTATFTPTNTGAHHFAIRTDSATVTTFEFDGVMVAKGNATPYFDGGVPLTLAPLRLLSKNWKYGSVDVDTRWGRLRRGIAPNADPTRALDFAQPIVWRSAEVPGELDPRPIDFNLAVGFYTGTRLGSNQISIYGRELTEDFMQQLDLNGQPQGAFTGHEQPDLGAAMYNERVQTDLEPFKQEQLEDLTQFDLERTPDYLSASWIEFVLNWTSTGTTLSVVNTEGDGYSFNLGTPLTANTNYVLVFELEDTSARAAIYPLGDRGQIQFNAPVFDSTRIDDDFSYKRRKGRFGWYASLEDGDASIESIRFRSASYAEYRSLPYESLTPVVGAELTAEASPPIDLFEYFVPTSTTIKVEPDNELSNSGRSWRVTDYGPFGFQGVQSNPFPITDFDQTEVLLDVYYPSSLELAATVEFYLKSQYDYLIPLPKPKVYPDQWQTVRLRTPSSHLAQTGDYRLVLVQNRPANLNWWIDNVRIFERTVSWHGRAYVDDPWAETEDDWTPFQNAFNRDYGGILFQGRESKLQIKGVGHKQDSTVGKVQFKPKYAELGRFVWPEQALTGRVPPVASYSTSNVGRLYTFDGFGSTDADGMVVNWQWSVSDGTVYTGPVIQHLFGASGTYSVTLMVTDHNGLVHTTSANHSVA